MKLVILAIFGLIISGCRPVEVNRTDAVFPAPLKSVSHTAGMAVFIQGRSIDLTQDQYINSRADVHLDAKFPGVIRVTKTPLTWQDFFDSIPINITDTCLELDSRSRYCNDDTNTLKIFLNDTLTKSLKSAPISDGDQILLSFGSEAGVQVERQLNQIPQTP